jgi:hypothetical protein
MADIAFFEGRQSTPVSPAYAVPAQPPLRMLSTKMDANPVGQVIVTPIVQDLLVGDFVREIRIMSLPTGGAEPEILLTVRLHALTVKQLEIITPPSTF